MIEAYAGTELVIVPEAVDTPVRNPAIRDFPGIKVTVYMLDDTGQQIPISEEIWDCLKVKSVKKRTKRVSWSVEKGSETGTYIVKPDYPGRPWKLSLFMYGAVKGRETLSDEEIFTAPDGIVVNKVSNISTGLTASGELGPMRFYGEGMAEMKVAPLTPQEIWQLIMWYVISAAIAIALIIGYSVKPRIKRGLKSHIVREKAQIACKRADIKNILLPVIPETATIHNFNPGMKCPIPDMKIKAYDNESFIITNLDKVCRNEIRINGAKVGPHNFESFIGVPFPYEGFTLAPVADAGSRVGKFYMT